MSKPKLFSEMSETEIVARLDTWRGLGNYLCGHIYEDVFEKIPLSELDSIRCKVWRLIRHPYKNKRLELKRWHALYESFKPILKASQRKFCNNGKKEAHLAQHLYSGKMLNKTFKVVPKTPITLIFPAYIDTVDLQNKCKVTLSIDNKETIFDCYLEEMEN